MEGHVNTPSEVLQSPKDLCRKRPALRGADQFQLRPLKGALKSQPHRRKFHTVLLGMTKEMLICIRRIIKCLLILALVLASLSVQSCRANWPEPLDTQPISQALVNISVMPLQSLHLRQHSRPTTEAYRTLRLQVPSTLILKAWIEEGEVGMSHPRGRPKPALHDACCCPGPRECSGNQGCQCLPLRVHQCLNSLCAHVPRHVRHSQALEVRSRATTCTQPKASLHHPLPPSGRATNGAEKPAQHRTHSGVRGAQASVCQLTVHASRHNCDHRASSEDALPFADQSIAFSSMPPDRYPPQQIQGPMGPEGRRTQNEWLARKGKGKGDGNTKGKGKRWWPWRPRQWKRGAARS